MVESRSYILDRLKSKVVTIDEFNYDRLEAPPISAMFTPYDIAQLNQIARSLKYAAKPEVKYKEIDKIMRSRGFEKFIAGTNRVVYRPLEDNRFLVKVAADAVGLGDNPREYANQFLFKPFITKVFEITPCGTLGVFERVVPITSREEFMSVAEDIYTVINDWFIGEYVLEDIGTRYFMNWGVRKNFGPVLLDFPYVYKLDGDKLFCNAPSVNSPSGYCEGVIDYDPGYNFLYCTKCGVKYKAKELAQAIEQNNIILKSEGEIKMKIRLDGGSNNLSKQVTTGMFSGMVKATPSKPIKTTSSESGIKVKINSNKELLVAEGSSATVKSSIIDEKVVVAEKSKEVINPIEFDESLIKKNNENDKKLLDKHIKDCNKEIAEMDNYTCTNDSTENLIETFVDMVSVLDERMSDIGIKEDIFSKIPMDIQRRLFYSILTRLSSEDISDDDISDIFTDIDKDLIDRIILVLFNKYFKIRADLADITMINDEDDSSVCLEISSDILKVVDLEMDEQETCILASAEPRYVKVDTEDFLDIVKDSGYRIYYGSDEDVENTEVESDIVEDIAYREPLYTSGAVINIKDLVPNQHSKKVIALLDEGGDYVRIANHIVVVDMVDDRTIDSLSLVSKSWLESLVKATENVDEGAMDENADNESMYNTEPLPENFMNRPVERSEAIADFANSHTTYAGILPPTTSEMEVAVNGVAVENTSEGDK